MKTARIKAYPVESSIFNLSIFDLFLMNSPYKWPGRAGQRLVRGPAIHRPERRQPGHPVGAENLSRQQDVSMDCCEAPLHRAWRAHVPPPSLRIARVSRALPGVPPGNRATQQVLHPAKTGTRALPDNSAFGGGIHPATSIIADTPEA
jgi:hypothetical protein